MKKIIAATLLIGLFGTPIASYAFDEPQSVTQIAKKNKGYKPKKKKFLGIFKRKSSCDCPKH